MSQLWKNFRVNLMYWRFRYVTRNRLRFKTWLARRRQPKTTAYRMRGTAVFVRPRSATRAWIALLAMVILLTAIRYFVSGSSFTYALYTLVIVGTVYWLLRGA